jgi:hypothetical protein
MTTRNKLYEPLNSSQRELLESDIDNLMKSVEYRTNKYLWKNEWAEILIGRDEVYDGAIDGLIRAAQNYGPESGAKFETFANLKIDYGIVDVARKFWRKDQNLIFNSSDLKIKYNNENICVDMVEYVGTPRNTFYDDYIDPEGIEQIFFDLGIEENLSLDLRLMGFNNKEISEALEMSYKKTNRNFNKIKERACRKGYFESD